MSDIGMEASTQRRRVSKPLIEKRRRARINRSLSQLVEMVAKPHKAPQQTRAARFEKAYILEMTVDYVRKLRDLSASSSHNPDFLEEDAFQVGYRLCMSEVKKFIEERFQDRTREFPTASLQMHLDNILNSSANNATPSLSQEDIDTTSLQGKSRFRSYRLNKRNICAKNPSEITMHSNLESDRLMKRDSPFASPLSAEDESASCFSESDSSSEEGKMLHYNKMDSNYGRASRYVHNAGVLLEENTVWRPW